MGKKKQKSLEEAKKKKSDEKLPYCRTAPCAEHSRAHDEDEPCDNGRTGNYEED